MIFCFYHKILCYRVFPVAVLILVRRLSLVKTTLDRQHLWNPYSKFKKVTTFRRFLSAAFFSPIAVPSETGTILIAQPVVSSCLSKIKQLFSVSPLLASFFIHNCENGKKMSENFFRSATRYRRCFLRHTTSCVQAGCFSVDTS